MLEGTKRRRSMRIASSFKRRSRPRERRAAAGWACVWIASFSFGCFFELEDVALPGIGGGGSGGIDDSAGTGGTSVGGTPIAGAGGSAGAVVCGVGQKDCGGGCVPISTDNGCGRATCTPCTALPHASVSCNVDTGNCQLEACDIGFADCDADSSAAAYTGQAGPNGCEYPFELTAGELRDATTTPLDVPLVNNIDIRDGSRNDWTGVPTYPLLATCDNCVDDALPPVIAQNELPSRRDLDAYFRVAWNQDFFYVLGDVYDSRLFTDGASLMLGQCQNGAPCEDGLQLFVDGRNDRASKPQYDNTDLRMFLGTSEKVLRFSGTPPNTNSSILDLDLKATVHKAACYRIEAKISWAFIVVPNGQAVPNLFPPAVGQEYGFDLAVNDWRPGASDETPRRESQLFWVSPAPDYRQVTTGFGPMRLSQGASGAGEVPQ
jgi:cellulose/xylan binding protein with CBM9 domain